MHKLVGAVWAAWAAIALALALVVLGEALALWVALGEALAVALGEALALGVALGDALAHQLA